MGCGVIEPNRRMRGPRRASRPRLVGTARVAAPLDVDQNGGLQPTDETLTATIGRRDESPEAWGHALGAFEVLYRRHGTRLVGFLANRVPRGEVDDVQQTVWQRVWQHLPERFGGGNFRAWLHQIARNYVVDERRRKRAELLPEDGEQRVPDESGIDPDSRLLESERSEILARCLEKLREEQSEVVRGRLGGESYESICERTGLSAARAHKLFHLAKEQLANCFRQSFS